MELTSKCTCKLCKAVIPFDKVRSVLSQDELDALQDAIWHEGVDDEVNRAKLAGEWSGWEWFKEYGCYPELVYKELEEWKKWKEIASL